MSIGSLSQICPSQAFLLLPYDRQLRSTSGIGVDHRRPCSPKVITIRHPRQSSPSVDRILCPAGWLAPATTTPDRTLPPVLRQLKTSVVASSVGPGSCLASWDFSVDPCDALFSDRFTCGFRCDAVDSAGSSRVTDISLDQAAYSGTLSAVS